MPTFPIGSAHAPGSIGHTLGEWQEKVAALVRDAAAVDLTAAQITTVGIAPAIARYSTDRQRLLVEEVPGAGSPYISLPSGWLAGFSSLSAIEVPARANPPSTLDSQSWKVVRSPSDVAVEQILLDRTPATGQYVRIEFTAPWPMPTAVAGFDKINDVAFEAVAALAASFCCVSLAGEASRSRSGALPSDFSDGRERGRNLMDAARMYRSSYDSFVGVGAGSAVSDEPPASGSFDVDPSRASLFHGGRR